MCYSLHTLQNLKKYLITANTLIRIAELYKKKRNLRNEGMVKSCCNSHRKFERAHKDTSFAIKVYSLLHMQDVAKNIFHFKIECTMWKFNNTLWIKERIYCNVMIFPFIIHVLSIEKKGDVVLIWFIFLDNLSSLYCKTKGHLEYFISLIFSAVNSSNASLLLGQNYAEQIKCILRARATM